MTDPLSPILPGTPASAPKRDEPKRPPLPQPPAPPEKDPDGESHVDDYAGGSRISYRGKPFAEHSMLYAPQAGKTNRLRTKRRQAPCR